MLNRSCVGPMSRAVAVMAVSAAAAFGPSARAGACDPHWLPGFDGQIWTVAGEVHAMATYDDGSGSGPQLYIGGDFFGIDTGQEFVEARNLAKWDGERWSAVLPVGEADCGGGPIGPVYALEVFNGALHVGGDFNFIAPYCDELIESSDNLARWDGQNWSSVGPGGSAGFFGGPVFALEVFNEGGQDKLFIGGAFDIVINNGGPIIDTPRIARWDGAQFSAVGPLSTNGAAVHALHVYDDGNGAQLYAGGDFFELGGAVSRSLARWNGAAWSDVGGGVDGRARALATYEGVLYVGGAFESVLGPVQGGPTLNLALWSAQGWTGIGGVRQINSCGGDPVRALWSDDSGLVSVLLGGQFDQVERSNGDTFDLRAFAQIAISDGVPTIFGGFGGVADDPCSSINSFVKGLASNYWVGGSFESGLGAGGGGVFRFYSSDGVFGVGDGLKYSEALYPEDGLVSLPDFSTPSGSSSVALRLGSGRELILGEQLVSGVAIYNPGQGWDNLQGGVDGPVYDIAVLSDCDFPPCIDTSLYVAGDFHFAGRPSAVFPVEPVPARSIAMFDGFEWHPLGSGINLPVYALEVYDDGGGEALYAACDFSSAGGVPVNRIAKWDGEQWHPLGALGSGVGQAAVFDMAVFDGELYVAGAFTSAGGDPSIKYLARWDGQTWRGCGAGVGSSEPFFDPNVRRLFILDDGTGPALFALGEFDRVEGQHSFGFAKWDGSQWDTLNAMPGEEPLFTNDPDDLFTMIRDAEDLNPGGLSSVFVVGEVRRLGGVPMEYIGRWNGITREWTSPAIGLQNPLNYGQPDPYILNLVEMNDGSGPKLYVGGDFLEAGGLAARRIAAYDGSSWSVLDIGLNEEESGGDDYAYVSTMAPVFDPSGPYGPQLYVGGYFRFAGAERSASIGVWEGCMPPPSPSPFGLVSPANGANGVPLTPAFSWQAAPGAESYALIVVRESDGAVVFAQEGLVGTQFNLPSGLLAPLENYSWCIVAVNVGGLTTANPAPSIFATATTGCVGDIDGDNFVGFTDLNIVLGSFNTALGQPGYNPDADLTGDGFVGFADLNIILGLFNTFCP